MEYKSLIGQPSTHHQGRMRWRQWARGKEAAAARMSKLSDARESEQLIERTPKSESILLLWMDSFVHDAREGILEVNLRTVEQ